MSVANHHLQCIGELTSPEVGSSKAACSPVAAPGCDFAEARVWESLGGGWHCIHGCYCQHGVSVEWHDFEDDKRRDWGRSFHPGSVEVCFNICGEASVTDGEVTALLGPKSIAIYSAAKAGLQAWRLPGARHQFLTVEFSPTFLERYLKDAGSALHPVVRLALNPRSKGCPIGGALRLTSALRRSADELRACPFSGHPATLWFQSRALDLMSRLFFERPVAGSSQSRQKELARTRVDKAIEVLRERLAEPPTLPELGRLVGCSPYYLSRTFSSEMGMTIPQHLRQIRMERAAELLRSGKHNVTEAALQVGYNSLSHFSQAFCEVMGCCPGLYPIAISGRSLSSRDRANSGPRFQQ